MVDFLEALYQQFDPAVALGANDQRYVDWQDELDADDLKARLARAIVLSPSMSGSIHLVSGLRGTGKTSELARVKGMLEGKFLNKTSLVITVNDVSWDGYSAASVMLKVMRAMAADDRLKAFLGGKSMADIGKRLNERLKLDLKVGVPLLGELSAKWDGEASRRAEIDGALDDYRSDILDVFNRGLRDALTAFRESGIDRIVVIVDELDKVTNPDAHRRLFIDGRPWFQGLACDVVLTLPWDMHQSEEGSRLGVDHKYGTALELGVIPVNERSGGANQKARNELREIVQKRWEQAAVEAKVGAQEDPIGALPRLDELIELSGGQLRVLFEMIRQAIVRADKGNAVDRAIESQIKQLSVSVDADKRALLANVHESHDSFTEDKNWQSLMRNGRILLYQSDGTWYDAHPLLVRWLDDRAYRGMA